MIAMGRSKGGKKTVEIDVAQSDLFVKIIANETQKYSEHLDGILQHKQYYFTKNQK